MAPVTERSRMPAWFITHGAGPMPILQPSHPNSAGLVGCLKNLASNLAAKPKAILLISGHFEREVPTVVTGGKPGILYDYNRFPPEAYELRYPAPGNPALAARVQELLREAGIEHASAEGRGFDHGVFVPLLIAFPEAKIPVVQLSLAISLDPQLHINIGKALASLRDEGVLIIGSGASFHGKADAKVTQSKEFDDWLQETLSKSDLSPSERETRFSEWEKAPHSKACHPREEHLIPCHVVLGASLCEKASTAFAYQAMGASCSSYTWA